MTPDDADPGPWGPRSGVPAPPSAAGDSGHPALAARGAPLIWNVISTIALAGWLGWQMGWQVAVAGVVGVFVHEYGHVMAMNRLGCGPARITIIPFMGGVATPTRAPATEYRGVIIALAGPVFGLVAMALPFLLYAVTGDAGWLRAAFFVAFFNLLNLFPAPPLDGSKALGPVLARIHPWAEKAAMLAVGLLAVAWAIKTENWLIGFVIALPILATLRGQSLRGYALRLTTGEQLIGAGLYVLAIFLCGLAMFTVLDGLGLPPTFGGVLAMLGFRL